MVIYPEFDSLKAKELYSKYEGFDLDYNEPDYVQDKTIFYEEVASLILEKRGESSY